MTEFLLSACKDGLLLYVFACLIDGVGLNFGVVIDLGVADMVFDELHLISGSDARML